MNRRRIPKEDDDQANYALLQRDLNVFLAGRCLLARQKNAHGKGDGNRGHCGTPDKETDRSRPTSGWIIMAYGRSVVGRSQWGFRLSKF